MLIPALTASPFVQILAGIALVLTRSRSLFHTYHLYEQATTYERIYVCACECMITMATTVFVACRNLPLQMTTMPGLPTRPCFYDIDLDCETEEVMGLF